ncbi:hypothetical protein OJAV_G00232990 [Oryzias javanicus]|uniref:Uncharacterized protein n=1 Tax=Oryzias javanicus TaxID=123683 RepID=A0A3S2NTL0_ORYJA|nr:hypothetical protein OJAV_G00232990 [Oryzias javanicus]
MSEKTEPDDACAASVEPIETMAEFQTDSLMQILSREDLNELFPGPEHLKLRKTIYEILHDQQTQEFLKNLEGFIKQDTLNDAAVVTEYLHRINNMMDQLDQMQTVLEAHVEMLKDVNESQVSQEGSSSDTDAFEIIDEKPGDDKIIEEQGGYLSHLGIPQYLSIPQYRSILPYLSIPPYVSIPPYFSIPQFIGNSFHGPPQRIPVKYKMKVCGETFEAHLQLLEKIKTPDLDLEERNDEESCITIVFCPVITRIGTDAEAAVRKAPDGDRVILVLMHYSQKPRHISFSKVLSSFSNVVLEVHIFYHDRQNGLLECEQNNNAVIELRKELIKDSRPHCSGPNEESQSCVNS